MIDHRHPELLLCPAQGLGVATLACEEERAETREVVAADVTALRVLLPDRAKRGRRGEERANVVLGDHSPEGSCVRRSDRLAFVKDRRAAVEERGVDDVGVPHDPAYVGGRPVHLAGLDVVDVLHRPG